MSDKPTYTVSHCEREMIWDVVRNDEVVLVYKDERSAEVVKNCLNFHAEDEEN